MWHLRQLVRLNIKRAWACPWFVLAVTVGGEWWLCDLGDWFKFRLDIVRLSLLFILIGDDVVNVSENRNNFSSTRSEEAIQYISHSIIVPYQPFNQIINYSDNYEAALCLNQYINPLTFLLTIGSTTLSNSVSSDRTNLLINHLLTDRFVKPTYLSINHTILSVNHFIKLNNQPNFKLATCPSSSRIINIQSLHDCINQPVRPT